LDQQKVPLVLLENVSFMLQLDRGAAMKRLTEAFGERGYRWAYRTINSLSFLPQRRERVFFVASKCEIEPSDVLFVDDVVPGWIATPVSTHAHGFYWTEGTRGLGWADDAIPTLKNGSTVGIPSPPAILLPSGLIIKPDIRDAERLQGFSEDWTQPAEETSRASLRWSLVGNSVTVDVAGWLGGRMNAPGKYYGDRDLAWNASARSWPKSARSVGKNKVSVQIGMYPVWKPRPALHDFLRYPGTPLSLKATAGFLSRAEHSSLRFVPGFLDHVRAHLLRMRKCRPGDDSRKSAAA
jgi:DNA (cytosine-5)-methyltransferase 1